MSNARCFKKAFTLIELIVAIGMALIVVSAAISMTILTKRQIAIGSDKLEAVQNARSIMDRLSRDLRQTNEVITPLNDINNAGDAKNEIEFENGHSSEKINYVKYYLNGNNLVKQEHHYKFNTDPNNWVVWNMRDNQDQPPVLVIDSSVIVANYVNQFNFWKNSDSLIRFEVIVAKNNKSAAMRTQVFGRNTQLSQPN